MQHKREMAAAASPGLLKRAYPFLRPLFQLALAGGLLAALLLRVDRAAVREQIGEADLIWLPLALAATIASQWFRAIRWRHLLLPLRRMSVRFLFASNLIGVVGNIALPLRAGEILRIQVVRGRSRLSVSSIVATVLSEKLVDVVVFSVFIVGGLLLFEEARFLWPLGVAYGVVVSVGVSGALYLARRVERQGEQAGSPAGGRLRAWLARELHHFARGFQSFRRPGALFHITWSACAAWLCEALMYYAFGRALGLDLSPGVYLLLVVTATIAVSVPITQAGFGVFELAIAGLLIAFGVNEAKAAAFAIFAHALPALTYIVSGPMAAFALRLSLPDILFLRKPNAVREDTRALEVAAGEPAAGS